MYPPIEPSFLRTRNTGRRPCAWRSVARIFQLALVREEQPAALEEELDLGLEDLGVGIDGAIDADPLLRSSISAGDAMFRQHGSPNRT